MQKAIHERRHDAGTFGLGEGEVSHDLNIRSSTGITYLVTGECPSLGAFVSSAIMDE